MRKTGIRDTKIGSLRANHTYRQILTRLTTAYQSDVLFLDQTAAAMVRCENLLVDNFVTERGIALVDEFNTADNLPRFGIVYGRAGTLDEDPSVGIFLVVERRLQIGGVGPHADSFDFIVVVFFSAVRFFSHRYTRVFELTFDHKYNREEGNRHRQDIGERVRQKVGGDEGHDHRRQHHVAHDIETGF